MMPAMPTPADILYGAPLSQFTAERTRLAKEGHKELAKAKKPTMSAWVVNQLHRQAEDEMKALFAAGARLRKGDFAAGADQKKALAALKARAADILRSDGHAAAEGTLLRVQQTLQALSALGWEPDEPGQLTTDRDPPGFDALADLEPGAVRPARREEPARPDPEERRRAAEREAELKKLEKAATAARADADARAEEVANLKLALEQAETALAQARAEAHEAEREYEKAKRRA